jgi:phosphopantetheinyl transferase (holo-ACP synthase)
MAQMPDAGNTAFWRRCLSGDEMTACMQRRDAQLHLAARLAAKRACRAVLGLCDAVDDRDMVVSPAVGAAPSITLKGAAAAHGREVILSMSHVTGWAGASAMAREREAQPSRWSCGFDLLDVARWRRAVERSGEALIERVCGPAERDGDSPLRTGLRFSIKECVVKAIGGLPVGACFHDITVDIGSGDSVRVHTSGPIAALLGRRAMDIHDATTERPRADLLQCTVVLGPTR